MMCNRREDIIAQDVRDYPAMRAILCGNVVAFRKALQEGVPVKCVCGFSGKFPNFMTILYPEKNIKIFLQMLQSFLDFASQESNPYIFLLEESLCISMVREKFAFSKQLIRLGCFDFPYSTDLMLMAVENADLRLVKMLLYSGYPLPCCETAVEYALRYRTDLVDLILDFFRQPMSLKALCRIKVRLLLGVNLARKVQKLDLPRECKHMLLFKEFL